MLYDRPYMRGPESRREISALAWVIGVIIGAFVLQKFAESTIPGSAWVHQYLTLSRSIANGYVWTLVTYGFLHADLLHILLNTLGIYLLGKTLLPIMGTQRFVVFFFATTILAGLVWLTVSFFTVVSGELTGVSGVICGLLAVFGTLYPEQRIGFLLIPWTIRARHGVLGFALISLVLMLASELPGKANIAHSAHLGGMLAGWLYGRYVHHRTGEFSLRPTIELPAWMRRRKRLKSGVTPSYTVNVSPPPQDLRAEVDRILDKINSEGFGALTEEERRALDDARDLLNKR